jgi:hypothetical protein
MPLCESGARILRVPGEVWQGECPKCHEKFDALYENQVRWQLRSHMERHMKKNALNS